MPCSAAVCLLGAPRTFALPHVVASIRHMFLERLECQADVFAVLATEDAAPKQQLNEATELGWSFSKVTPDVAELDSALDLLRPKVREHYTSLQPELNSECTPRNGTFWAAYGDRLVAQLESWARCLGHVEAAETERAASYDWIIKTRPDAYWRAPHPPLGRGSLTSSTLAMHVYPFQDHHIVLPRRLAATILRGMLQEYRACRGRWPIAGLNQWLEKTAERTCVQHTDRQAVVNGSAAQRCRVLGPPCVQPLFPLVLVRASADEPSARTMCRRAEGVSVPESARDPPDLLPKVTRCMNEVYPGRAARLSVPPLSAPTTRPVRAHGRRLLHRSFLSGLGGFAASC